MAFTLHGIPVSGGIAIGRAHLITHATLEVAHYLIEESAVPEEWARFDQAVATVRAELQTLRDEVMGQSGDELAAFIDVHIALLADASLTIEPKRTIELRRCNAEWALIQQMDMLAAQFDEFEDAYLRERKNDVVQVVERVLKVLLGKKTLVPPKQSAEGDMIVVAHDLSPADMLLFKQHTFAGFVTDVGGVTSHTAIMARSLALPAIVALRHARELVREGDNIIIDGTQGVMVVDPEPSVLDEFRLKARELGIKKDRLKRLVGAKAETLDGVVAQLMANIELPDDVPGAVAAGAEGVGLFRTEFLFMNRKTLPSEEEQFEAYRAVVQGMGGKPVTIRTLDIGADKLAGLSADARTERMRSMANPALGLRAVRYSLAEPQLFLAQLRALLRASHYGPTQILLPMLAHKQEIDQSLAYVAQAKRQLADKDIPFDANIKVGGMIEVPAAALSLSMFLSKLDFLSIGTNDLIQYTLAIDRTDEAVASLYDPLHPAVLQLLAQTITMARRANVEVAVCGEMAGEVTYARLLLGLGLREFSMHPAQLLTVKQQIVQTRFGDAETFAQRIMHADDPMQIRALLAEMNG